MVYKAERCFPFAVAAFLKTNLFATAPTKVISSMKPWRSTFRLKKYNNVRITAFSEACVLLKNHDKNKQIKDYAYTVMHSL